MLLAEAKRTPCRTGVRSDAGGDPRHGWREPFWQLPNAPCVENDVVRCRYFKRTFDRRAAWPHPRGIAEERRLTTDDAAYLELAERRRTPLATLNKALASAARKRNVVFLGATFAESAPDAV